MRSLPIPMPRDPLAKFCRRHHIRRLSLFGSILRDDFGPDSDIDVLVEFDPLHIPGLVRLSAMELELAEVFGGRKVDFRTAEDLSRYFCQEVIASAETLYAA